MAPQQRPSNSVERADGADLPSGSDLLALPFKALFELFGQLEAPTIREMDGEYAARLLAQPNRFADICGRMSVNNPLLAGRWLCKAFHPLGMHDALGERGRGYNSFVHFGRTVRRFPMQTLVAPSRYDGRPAFQLVYRAFHSMCGDIHMVDEIRRVADGLYLGFGTWGFTDRQRRIALPFELQGPVAPYRSDFGRARAGFDLRHEIPALRAPIASP